MTWGDEGTEEKYYYYFRKGCEQEALNENLIFQYFNAVIFTSHSNGKNKKRRRNSKTVVLIRTKESRKWRLWNMESDKISRTLPWDGWAQEIFSEQGYVPSTKHSPDYLREQLKELILKHKRF